MTRELEQLLKNLKLRRILEIYDEQARAAEKDDLSYSDFVARLVRAQWQAKQEGALEWRIRRANLPERWTLETHSSSRSLHPPLSFVLDLKMVVSHQASPARRMVKPHRNGRHRASARRAALRKGRKLAAHRGDSVKRSASEITRSTIGRRSANTA